MDLPKAKYYGVRCPYCSHTLWYDTESKASLKCTVSFKDKGLPLIRENVGMVIGYCNMPHICRPELN